MNEKVDVILFMLKDEFATKKDMIEVKDLANQGNTKAVLNYGTCLFVDHKIGEDREETARYFEKVYFGGKIVELNELASFYDEVGGLLIAA